MIKQSIKNYFINLKHFFTPLGTFFLGVVLGLSVLIPGSINLISNLGQNVGDLINNTTLNFDALMDTIISNISDLNWADFGSAMRTLFNPEFLAKVLDSALHALVGGDYGIYVDEIAIMIDNTIKGFIPLAVVLIITSILGLILGFFLTKYLVRKEVAKRTFGKFILATLVDSILSAGVIAFIIWLSTIWKYSGIFVLLVAIILFSFTSLLEAYIVHKNDKLKFKTVVNLKNSGFLSTSNALIFVLSILFIGLVSYLINPFVGVFVGVSFVEIAFVVINLNAEAYVKSLAERK